MEEPSFEEPDDSLSDRLLQFPVLSSEDGTLPF